MIGRSPLEVATTQLITRCLIVPFSEAAVKSNMNFTGDILTSVRSVVVPNRV